MVLFGLIWVSLVLLSTLGLLVVLRSELAPHLVRGGMFYSPFQAVAARQPSEVRCASPPGRARLTTWQGVRLSEILYPLIRFLTGCDRQSASCGQRWLRGRVGLPSADSPFASPLTGRPPRGDCGFPGRSASCLR